MKKMKKPMKIQALRTSCHSIRARKYMASEIAVTGRM